MPLASKPRKGSQPLLTIAIPTYNRADYLDLCLRKISEEMSRLSKQYRNLVKIYVSDNASLDNSYKMASKYRLENAYNVEVVRNITNIGADLNIVQCYESASTPYVWVFGDDDVILKGGLAKVLDVLLRHDVDILSVGCKPYQDDPDEQSTRVSLIDSNEPRIFNSAHSFVKRTNISLTFISSLIIRTGHGSRHAYKETDGSNLSQLCWVSSLLCKGRSFAIIEFPIVAAKANNTGGYGLVEVFGNNLQEITKILLKEKPDLIMIMQNGAIVNFFPSFIMGLRSKQISFAMEDNLSHRLKHLYQNNWRYYIFLAPLTSLPLRSAKLFNIFLKIVRRVFSPLLI